MRMRWWWFGVASTVLLLLGGTALRTSRLSRIWQPPRAHTGAGPLVGRPLPSLESGVTWLHSPPIRARDLAGRVVAIQFWDSATPAGLWAASTMRAWEERYASRLRVLLVHVPAFTFGQDRENTEAACRRLGVELPVALDSDYSLWRRFGARALPQLVIADARGIVRLDVAGVGTAWPAERALRGVLAERRGAALPPPVARVPEEDAAGEATAPVPLGAGRPARGPLAKARAGETHAFTPALEFQVEQGDGVPVPVGRWFTGSEALRSARGSAEDYLALRYHAGDVYAVMGAAQGAEGKVWVLQDDRWLSKGELGADARQDDRGASSVVLDQPRVYHVVSNRTAGSHVLKLQPDRPGLDLYQFYFDPLPLEGSAARLNQP